MTVEYKDSKRITAVSSDWETDVTSNITWSTTGKVGWDISGTTISRTGSAGWSTSKIQSTDTFTVGDGKFVIEFSGIHNDLNSTMIGFNQGTLGYHFGSGSPQNNCDFAIYVAGGSRVEVYESGNKNYDSGGSRNANDKFRIEIDNSGVVKYYLQEGGTGSFDLKHTSSSTASGTYFIQANAYASTSEVTVHSKIVTTAVAKPSNVQDNSLLIEKDAPRRYWFVPNTVTLQSDFSSSTGWTTSSSSLLNVDTSAQEIDFTFNVDNGDIGTMYYDLTSTSDTKWLLRSQVDIDTISQGSDTNDKWLFYGLSSTNNGANETQDFLGMAIRVDNTKTELLAIETDGSAPNNESTTVFTRNAQAETLYVEMKRESATSFTVSLYSDSSYSTLLESKTITASSGTATLRYLKLSGLQGFSDSQIVGSIPNITFYNSATEPTTWTKQIKTPTNEDLEDQTWTKSTSDLTQGDSYIQWANMTGGTENGYYDLGSGSVSDTKWVLRAKLTISSYSSGGAAQSRWCGLGLSSSSSTFTGTQDSINIILRTNTSSDTIAATRSNGTDVSGQLGTAGISGVTLGNGTFYLELIRESDSDYKLYVRSDSHTGTLLGTGTYTNASGVTGLRYIKTDRLLQSSATGDFVAKWEDIDFWNGITEP